MVGFFTLKNGQKIRIQVEDLLEISNDAMKYVVIEERFLEPLKK